jgi:hypothetical protein
MKIAIIDSQENISFMEIEDIMKISVDLLKHSIFIIDLENYTIYKSRYGYPHEGLLDTINLSYFNKIVNKFHKQNEPNFQKKYPCTYGE